MAQLTFIAAASMFLLSFIISYICHYLFFPGELSKVFVYPPSVKELLFGEL
jgi:hypothetical protein